MNLADGYSRWFWPTDFVQIVNQCQQLKKRVKKCLIFQVVKNWTFDLVLNLLFLGFLFLGYGLPARVSVSLLDKGQWIVSIILVLLLGHH
jgi:hypothetical protein